MKKIIKRIIAIALSCLNVFCVTACNWNWENTDGEFIYKYRNSPNYGKCYMITGSTEEGKKYKENVYVPTHFNGLPVYYTFTSSAGFTGAGMSTHTMQVNCKNLYFNYIQKYDFIFGGKAEYIFVPESTETMSYHIDTLAKDSTSGIVYVSKITYDYIKEWASSSASAKEWSEINEFTYIRQVQENDKIQYTITIINANITYLFNYTGAPNEGIFFINNIGNGELIEDTPYEPIRDGYVFEGWYKEPACINKCNFGADMYIEQYDSEGNLIFNELKLYAKWIEN